MQKIAHFINSNMYSGLEKVAITIMESLKDEFEFVYVTKNGPIVDILKEKNINYYIIDKMNSQNIKKFIKEWQPDILHAHDFRASVVCAKVHGNIPLIEHIHNNASWIKKINFKSIAFLYAGLKANKILTVSDSIENEYIFSKYLKNKITCIDNPVSRQEILNKVDKEYEKKYDICCVGRLVKEKNPQKFIKLVKELTKDYPKIKAIWVGDGELKEECLELINSLNLQNNIELVGFQINPYPFIAKSKIFVLTSIWEGYGLAAFEALTLGLPCVVSNVGGLKEIVDDNCGKLCTTNEDYIKEIKELLKDSSIKSKNAIEKSKKLDNLTEYMKVIKNIYK